MKDLGKSKYFLVIEVAYLKKSIFISRRKYVLDLLKKIGKIDCKTIEVHIEQSHRFGDDDCE